MRNKQPQKSFDKIKDQIDNGQFATALAEVDRILQRPAANDEWEWRFRLLKARILVWRKQPEEVLSLLREEVPANLASTEIAEQRKLMQGMAHRAAQRFREAESAFDEAEKLAANLSPSVQCSLLIAKSGLEISQRRFARP